MHLTNESGKTMKTEPTSKAGALLRSLQVVFIPGLRPAFTTVARRIALPLLVLGGGLLLVRPAAAAPFKWENTGSLTTTRQFHTATLLPNGKVLVAGGWNYPGYTNYLASAELYDPATGTWTATGSMAAARTNHTATLLPTGQVLVAGGIASAGTLASAELYDPATGTWTTTGSLTTARWSHTATLLPNGKVLVAGGGYGDSAELYDPATGSWTATGSLAQTRQSHTATLLPNGMVLVAGGYSYPTGDVASAELYDPASGTWTGHRQSRRRTAGPHGDVAAQR